MPKLIMSIDGVVIKEVQLTKERTTLGRRPYNDVVIDNLAVSGEHAVVEMSGPDVFLEDLNSTNGTYVNGKAVKRQQLQHNDTIEIGKYRIKYLGEVAGANFDKTQLVRPMSHAPAPETPPAAAEAQARAAVIRLLTGSAAGRELPLTKVVTTVGRPGVAVAAITRRPQGYVLSHVDGADPATLNGAAIGEQPVTLHAGDVIELAGIQMRFVQD